MSYMRIDLDFIDLKCYHNKDKKVTFLRTYCKGSIGEWCNIAWKIPHTSEMRNLMVGGPKKPIHNW
jgi:hypothetical protein